MCLRGEARGRSASVLLDSAVAAKDQELANVSHLRLCMLSVIVKVCLGGEARGPGQDRDLATVNHLRPDSVGC